jgi:hypothetical protein
VHENFATGSVDPIRFSVAEGPCPSLRLTKVSRVRSSHQVQVLAWDQSPEVVHRRRSRAVAAATAMQPWRRAAASTRLPTTTWPVDRRAVHCSGEHRQPDSALTIDSVEHRRRAGTQAVTIGQAANGQICRSVNRRTIQSTSARPCRVSTSFLYHLSYAHTSEPAALPSRTLAGLSKHGAVADPGAGTWVQPSLSRFWTAPAMIKRYGPEPAQSPGRNNPAAGTVGEERHALTKRQTSPDWTNTLIPYISIYVRCAGVSRATGSTGD